MSFSAYTCLAHTGTTTLGPTINFYSNIGGYSTIFTSKLVSQITNENCPFILTGIPDGTTTILMRDPVSTSCLYIPVSTEVPLTACFYNMVEIPYYIYEYLSECSTEGIPPNEITITAFTFYIDSLIVNGIEYVTGPPLLSAVTFNNINIIPAAIPTEYVKNPPLCNPVMTGFTYTNFVDFLNSTFSTLGLSNYRAQISLVGRDLGNNSQSGFYIIHPSTDSFSISIGDEWQTSPFIYTQNQILYEGSKVYFRTMTCCDINLVGNVVIEL